MIRFDSMQALADWQTINDAVMGGVSSSRIDYVAAGHAAFSGVVSLANNGGFASVRCRVVEPCREPISAYVLTARGDGKTYKLSLRMDPNFDGISYQARFQAAPGDWTRIRMPVTSFLPTWRGRLIADAPLLDPTRVRQLGLMIADAQAGPFRLEIRSIEPLP